MEWITIKEVGLSKDTYRLVVTSENKVYDTFLCNIIYAEEEIKGAIQGLTQYTTKRNALFASAVTRALYRIIYGMKRYDLLLHIKGESEKSGQLFFYSSYGRDQKEKIVVRSVDRMGGHCDIADTLISKEAYNNFRKDFEAVLRGIKVRQESQ